RLLGCFGQPLLAQPIDGDFHVTATFGQRRLAIHHAGASLVAQLFYHRGGDRRHVLLICWWAQLRLSPLRSDFVTPAVEDGKTHQATDFATRFLAADRKSVV